MWFTILVMAAAVSLEPFRIAMTVLMLNRPGPLLQLIAFLSGGFIMGTTVGMVVLFAARSAVAGSNHFTLPTVQITIGVLALLVAAVLAARAFADRFGTNGPPERFARAVKLPAPVQRLLNGPSLWVAGVAGLGIALPSVDYLAALAVIVASGTPAMTQVAALLTFNLLAFALVEVPLLAYLVAPDATRRWISALNDWIRRRRRHEVSALLAGLGCVLLAVGLANL